MDFRKTGGEEGSIPPSPSLRTGSRAEGDAGEGVGEGGGKESAGILLSFEFHPENPQHAICLILFDQCTPEMKV